MTPWQVIEEALAHKRPPRGPKWLADELKETIQTVSNWKARGVPPRRYREIANVLGLTLDQVEGLEPLPWDRSTDGGAWPFSEELHQKVLRLSDEELLRAENILRGFVWLPQKTVSVFTNKGAFSQDDRSARPYSGATEVGLGAMETEAGLPNPKRHARKADQRATRQKGGGGA